MVVFGVTETQTLTRNTHKLLEVFVDGGEEEGNETKE